MTWLAEQGKEKIQATAKYVMIGGVVILLGYAVFRNPNIIVKWAQLPVTAAKGAVNFVGGSIKTGSNAVLAIPRALGVANE